MLFVSPGTDRGEKGVLRVFMVRPRPCWLEKFKQAKLLSDTDRVMFELTVYCRVCKYGGDVVQLRLPTLVAFEEVSDPDYLHFSAAGGWAVVWILSCETTSPSPEMEQVAVGNAQWRAGQSGVPLVNRGEDGSVGTAVPTPCGRRATKERKRAATAAGT